MFTSANFIKAITLFNDKIDDNKGYLSELDTPIGDGDHGNNMARGMEAVMAITFSDDLATDFKQVAMALISKVGGASGPLYGTAMLEMSKAAANSAEPLVLLEAAVAGIERRGQAVAGEKTMLDVWIPCVELIRVNNLSAANINAYAEKTADIKATKGRASYLGDRSIGHIDPGAMSSAYFFEALLEAGVFND